MEIRHTRRDPGLNDFLHAQKIYDYLAVRDPLELADLIIGFGVFDLKVPTYCATLYQGRKAPMILFTGGVGSGSGSLSEPEAVAFQKQAMKLGVPGDAIWIESKSTNTGENVEFSLALINQKQLQIRSALLVALPHRQRRVFLTCRKRMGPLRWINAPPPSTFEQEMSLFGGLNEYLPHLRGEIERIFRYGALGYLTAEKIPEDLLGHE